MVQLIKMLDKDGAEIVTQGDLMNNAIRAAMDAVLKAFIHYDKQYHMLVRKRGRIFYIYKDSIEK